MAQVMSCPDRDVLHRLMLGELTGPKNESLLLHLERCPNCSAVVSTFRTSDTLLDAARQPATIAEETEGEAVRSLVEQLRRRGPPTATAPSATPSVDTPTLISGESCTFLSPALEPGEIGRLGQYRVVKLLGGGAMGMVFQAEDIALKRRVALKIMKPELADRPTARERFLREARAAAALEHEHIVTIYQVGEERGVPFLAMQLLRGESLEARLKRAGRPAADEILRLGQQIARGLAAAHAQGLIHRDIKPANLWLEEASSEPGGLSPRARVKIVDFGLARAVEGEAQLTQSGTVLGTPAYMAPEQARGDKVDARCDLFSLGCVLYRMCTGRMPFPGDSTFSVLHALATHTPPPVGELNPTVPPALGKLVMQLLAKEPGGRPASAREVADRLQGLERQLAAPPVVDSSQTETIPSIVSESAQPSAIIRPVPRRWLPATAVALLALLPLGYMFGGQIIRIATDKGRVVIEVDDPGVEVTVKEKGAVIQDRAGQREITLAAGDHELELEVKDAAGKLHLRTKQFTLSRGGKEIIKVRQELARANETKTEKAGGAGEGTPTVRSTDPDRLAAEWVLSIGGTVRVAGHAQDISDAKNLPPSAFQLTTVSLTGNRQVTDTSLARLSGLRSLSYLSLFSTKVSDAGLAHLKGLTSLTWLGLYGTQVGDTGLEHIKGLTNLRNLSLYGTRVSDAGLVHLKGMLSLTNLELRFTAVGNAGLTHLKGLTSLTTLDVSVTQVTDAGLEQLKGLSNLTYLNLNRLRVTDAGVAHLHALTHLQNLHINDTRVTSAGVAAVQKALPLCKTTWGSDRSVAEWVLTKGGQVTLRMAKGNDVTVKAAKDLPAEDYQLVRVNFNGDSRFTDADLERLQGLANLNNLHLQGGRFRVSDAGLARLKNLPALGLLALQSSDVTDAGLKHLTTLPRLDSLDLSGTRVKDRGLEHLIAVPRLALLNLSKCQLTDDGLAHLSGIKRLFKLDLTGTNVTAAGIAELRRALPNCQITWDGTYETERSAAKWVLAIAGKAVLWVDGRDQPILPGSDLPPGNFQIVSIDLDRNEQVTDEGLGHLRGLLRLRALNLQNTRVGDAGMAHVAMLPNLENLSLHGTQVGDAGLERLKALTNLTDLALSLTRVSNAGLAHLKAFSKLAKLTLAATPITDAGLVHLRALTNLNMLGINNNTRVTDAGLSHLRGMPNLGHLYLHNTRVTDAGMAHLQSLPKLGALRLSGTGVTGDGLKLLPKLTWLELDGTAVGDTGLAQIKSLKNLTYLQLSRTRVSDAGLEHLAGLTQLHDLFLANTGVSDAGIVHLRGLAQMANLDLTGTKVTPASAAELQTALPKCKIVAAPAGP